MIQELIPRFLLVLSENIIVVAIKGDTVLLNVCEQIISSQNLGNLYKLIVVILTLEEWLFLENHAGKHASQRPNI